MKNPSNKRQFNVNLFDALIILHCPFSQFHPNLNLGSKTNDQAKSPPIIQITATVSKIFILLSQKLLQNTGFVKFIHLDNATKLKDNKSIRINAAVMGPTILQVDEPQGHFSEKYVDTKIGPKIRQQQRSTNARCNTNTVVVSKFLFSSLFVESV